MSPGTGTSAPESVDMLLQHYLYTTKQTITSSSSFYPTWVPMPVGICLLIPGARRDMGETWERHRETGPGELLGTCIAVYIWAAQSPARHVDSR